MKKFLLAAIIIVSFVSHYIAAEEVLTLLTDAEGAMKDAPSGLFEVASPFNNGPEITVRTPELGGEYVSPVMIDVLFVERDGKKVDLSKLKVECLKFITLDLTDRVLPFATPEGIKVENAKLPKGSHKLKITVGDEEGGITEETFIVKIVK